MGSDQTLTSTLKALQEQYRRQLLESRLEDVAGNLRDIKLQFAIMDELFDVDVSVDPELSDIVQRTRADLASSDYDELEARIGKLEQKAKSERSSVEQSLSQQLVFHQDQVNAMLRLNEKINAYNQGSLEALEVLLDEWNWKEAATVEDYEDFEAQLEACKEFGADMRAVYQEAQDAIIAPLVDEGIKNVVDSLLDSETVYISDLTDTERETLVESELGDYIRLSLA